MANLSRKPVGSRDIRAVTPAINKNLYDLLKLRFRNVSISAEGEHTVFGRPIVSVTRGGAESTFMHEGEYYRVNCPYCGDTRQRMYVNHRWMTEDPINGRPLRHLATCFNADCLKKHYAEFESLILEPLNLSTRDAIKRLAVPGDIVVDIESTPLGAVAMPGDVVPVDALPGDHRAARYLRDRGFDLAELASRHRVGFCTRSSGLYPGIAQRIFIPVLYRGDMVGWQGRWPSDDYRKEGAAKYYNMTSFKKSHVLYGFDAAVGSDHIIVTEGVTDVWAVGASTVAVLGKTISIQQQALLSRWADSGSLLILLLDGDAWTAASCDQEALAVKHARLISSLRESFSGRVVEVRLANGQDPANYDRRVLRRLVREHVRVAGYSPRRYGL